jgi:hypothetical protein
MGKKAEKVCWKCQILLFHGRVSVQNCKHIVLQNKKALSLNHFYNFCPFKEFPLKISHYRQMYLRLNCFCNFIPVSSVDFN